MPGVPSFGPKYSVRTAVRGARLPQRLGLTGPCGTLAPRLRSGTIPAVQIIGGNTTPHSTPLHGVVPHLTAIRFLLVQRAEVSVSDSSGQIDELSKTGPSRESNPGPPSP